jgi:hypothetical protein
MGFLWTLWALIDSFIFRGLSKDESVFRAFGYALVTTATGMFVRLLLLQFMFWSDDQQALADREIDNSLTIFLKSVGEVTDSLASLKSNLEEVHKTHAESVKAANAAITAAAEDKLNRLESAVDQVVTSIRSRADSLTKAIDTAVQEASAATVSISESTAKASGEASKAASSARSAEVARLQCLKVSEEADALRNTTAALSSHVDLLDTRVANNEVDVKQVGNAVSASLAQVAVEVAEATQNAKAAMSVKADVVELRLNLSQLVEENAGLKRDTNSLAETVTSSISKVSAAEAQAAESSKSVATVLHDVKLLRSDVTRLSRQIDVQPRQQAHGPSATYVPPEQPSWIRRALNWFR